MRKTKDEPIPYSVLPDPDRMHGAADEFGGSDYAVTPAADAALGPTPDTVPANESKGLELSVYGNGGSKPLRELRIGEARCPRCRNLLAELLQAVTDFTTLSRPVIQRYASLSYGELRAFEAALKPHSERVKTLRAKYEKHQRDAGHR